MEVMMAVIIADDKGVGGGAGPGLLLKHHQHVAGLGQLALCGQGAGGRQLLVTRRAGVRVEVKFEGSSVTIYKTTVHL